MQCRDFTVTIFPSLQFEQTRKLAKEVSGGSLFPSGPCSSVNWLAGTCSPFAKKRTGEPKITRLSLFNTKKSVAFLTNYFQLSIGFDKVAQISKSRLSYGLFDCLSLCT